ncbi:uncharacterized protein BP5553_08420 [Venustampulla echinocandica]|uniref:Uncharacterized protein n=1 Tax=Venustampulla echinocandica TaxID=2656787 RepID=A0A370TE86_9HELO|nr:uncharacterized protein BP5553_08420 [Venustampulla echinocandica]RDL32981.1 hypothetical protein BP5553_08420 [Venustampulla echinocandica]
MKTIPLLTALLSLKALGVYALNCNTADPLKADGPSGVDIASSLQLGGNGTIDDICNNRFKDIGAGPIIYNAGPIVFSLSQTEGVLHPKGDCKSALTSIISQCIVTQNVWGGSVETEGLLFEIMEGGDDDEDADEDYDEDDDEDDDEHGIQARANKKKGGAKPAKGTKAKDKKVKSKKVKTKKTKTKATKTKKSTSTKVSTSNCQEATGKAKGKGKGKGKGKKGDKGKRAEPEGDSCSAPELDCSKAFAVAAKQLQELQPLEARDLFTSPIDGRDFYVGSMSGMAHYSNIQKRGPKKGKLFSISWNAGSSPDVSNKRTDTLAYYGWDFPRSCDDYTWKGPFTKAEAKKIRTKGSPESKKAKYEIEHIMEWQIVTGFFDWIATTKAKGNKFPNPDGSDKKVDFATYFKATWVMDGENKDPGQTFELVASDGTPEGQPLTPREHLASVYPSVNEHIDEFVYLEAEINAPAKAQTFSSANKDTVFSKDTTTKNIESQPAKVDKKSGKKKGKDGTPETQIILLKSLIGVRKYMRTPAINETFNAQQKRMGEMLGKLDSQLGKHPKKAIAATDDEESESESESESEADKTDFAWQEMGLKALWGEWMDLRFETGVKRMNFEMNDGIKRLEKIPKADKKLKESIAKLKKEWDTEKKSAWDMPWPKHPKAEVKIPKKDKTTDDEKTEDESE